MGLNATRALSTGLRFFFLSVHRINTDKIFIFFIFYHYFKDKVINRLQSLALCHIVTDCYRAIVTTTTNNTVSSLLAQCTILLHIDLRPSRQSRNRCIRSKISRSWPWTGWILCKCDAHRKQVVVKQLYNPVPQRVRVSWSQLQLKFELPLETVRTSSQQRAWALRTPGWAVQQNEKEVLLKTEKLWGQYVAVCSVSNSPLTHNPFATLSNKVWEVYFSKEVCSFVIVVDFVSACICIRIVVSRLYNNKSSLVPI